MNKNCCGLPHKKRSYQYSISNSPIFRARNDHKKKQVDRSAAYAARWVAKSIVKAGLCHRILVQLSYAIGVPYPLSIHVDTFGTAATRSGKSDEDIVKIINHNFDLRPGCLVRDLNLRRPIFQKTAAYGHFGREDADFTWETAKELDLVIPA